MDFFEHQAAARRRTSLLVAYFVVAVVLIVAALNVAAAALGAWIRPEFVEYVYSPDRSRVLFRWDAEVAAWTTGLTLLVILGGTLYRWLTLRSGGRAVAELAGGRELAPGTANPAERRLDSRFGKIRNRAKQALAHGERRKSGRNPYAERTEHKPSGNH